MRRYLLGLDFGTSGIKSVVFDPESGNGVGTYQTWHTKMRAPGYSELDTSEMWPRMLECIRASLEAAGITAGQVASISSCSLCPGLIALDEAGRELTPAIIYQDMRSAEQAERLVRETGGRYFHIMGSRMMSGSTSVTTMLWLKEHQSDIYTRTRWFVHIPSWVGYRLTGKVAMDWSQAAATGLFDIHTHSWSEEMLRLSGLEKDLLPTLACGNTLLGELNNPELLDMGFAIGTPVTVGGGDTACTALALNATSHGDMFLSMGTSSVLTICTEQDVFDDRLVNRCHVVPERWIMTGAMSTTGGALKWFLNAFCPELVEAERIGGPNAFQAIDQTVQARWSEPNEILFLPYMNGERSPVFDPNARGVFLGFGLGADRVDFARAIMESAGFGVNQFMNIAVHERRADLGELIMVGGGSRSVAWCRIIADIIQIPIKTVKLLDAGAVGAALLGGMATGQLPIDYCMPIEITGTYEPDPKTADWYEEKFKKYLQLYPACRDLYLHKR